MIRKLFGITFICTAFISHSVNLYIPNISNMKVNTESSDLIVIGEPYFNELKGKQVISEFKDKISYKEFRILKHVHVKEVIKGNIKYQGERIDIKYLPITPADLFICNGGHGAQDAIESGKEYVLFFNYSSDKKSKTVYYDGIYLGYKYLPKVQKYITEQLVSKIINVALESYIKIKLSLDSIL